MKYFLVVILFLTSCTKTNQPQIKETESKPTMVKIEVVYTDGSSGLSPIVVAR
jgi:hypothetical protein